MALELSQTEKEENAANGQPKWPRDERLRQHLGRAMKLSDVFAGLEVQIPSSANGLEIRQVACDSRKVNSGALFFALHGAKADGNTFIRDAISRGATVIASEETTPNGLSGSVAWIRLREARKAMAVASTNFFGHPAEALQLAAVTGTNGKTTTASLVDSIVKASGAKTGLFGTIAYHTPLGDYPAPNTTPESVDLQGFFAEIRDAGGKYAVLEASSHSLMMDRLWGCHFVAAVFTNHPLMMLGRSGGDGDAGSVRPGRRP